LLLKVGAFGPALKAGSPVTGSVKFDFMGAFLARREYDSPILDIGV
jgi:hypothetical protein